MLQYFSLHTYPHKIGCVNSIVQLAKMAYMAAWFEENQSSLYFLPERRKPKTQQFIQLSNIIPINNTLVGFHLALTIRGFVSSMRRSKIIRCEFL